MNVSPLDLRQQRFHKSFRGFDRLEVSSFLQAVADDYEHALHDADRLRQELMQAQTALNEHRDHQNSLMATLVNAKKLANDIKTHAQDEGQRIVREAQSRAALLLERTQSRLAEVQREIDALRLKRRDVETSLESTIALLRNTLEAVKEQDARGNEDNLLLHRWRPVETEDEDSPKHTEEFTLAVSS
jgi:cell division initiation protein